MLYSDHIAGADWYKGEVMEETENQMGLFELPKVNKPAAKPVKTVPIATPRQKTAAKPSARVVKSSPVKISGLVPEGDVRLTANIRQDLHLKLKIAAAHKRTTIGEMIEALIDRYV